MIEDPRGIAGLVGREPIACVLTVGIKGPSGAPTEKDRFHILETSSVQREYSKRDGGTYKSPSRDRHPLFAAFNGAPPERRRTVPARLAHVTVAEMFEYRRQCQSAPTLAAHQKKAPACIGDGVVAKRWTGADYVTIPCPGEKCEFSQAGTKNGKPTKPPCGPWMRFVARFDWPRTDGKGLPNLPFKLTSGSWNTTREFLGFFDAFRAACRGFGVDPADVPLFGMPVQLSLSERTNAEQQSRYPVVSVTMAGDADLIAWIGAQLERRQSIKQLAAAAPVLALTDAGSHTPEVIDGDYQTISALGVPGHKD